MSKPKLVINSEDSLEKLKELIAEVLPTSTVGHFEEGAYIILLKHKISSRKYMTVGRVIIHKKCFDKYQKLAEKIISNFMQKRHKENLTKVRQWRLENSYAPVSV